MENWSKSLQRETSFAEKIVEGFTPEQCRALYFKEPFELEVNRGKDICQICTEGECSRVGKKCENCIQGDKFRLEGAQLSEFRWYVIGYLNMLESVMMQGFSDEEKSQLMEYVTRMKNNMKTALDEMGVDPFPVPVPRKEGKKL